MLVLDADDTPVGTEIDIVIEPWFVLSPIVASDIGLGVALSCVGMPPVRC